MVFTDLLVRRVARETTAPGSLRHSERMATLIEPVKNDATTPSLVWLVRSAGMEGGARELADSAKKGEVLALIAWKDAYPVGYACELADPKVWTREGHEDVTSLLEDALAASR